MDDVTQHPPIHHPLEVSYDSIVDEPQLSYQCFTLITYCHVNHPTSTAPYQCFFLSKIFLFFDINIGLANHKGFFNLKKYKKLQIFH
jgi:hypothetical protein